jgi:hypothetical protein
LAFAQGEDRADLTFEATAPDTLRAAQTVAEKQGTVTYVVGELKRKPVEVETWANAPEKSPVVAGDKVRTLRRSRAELELAQSGLIRLAPMTTIDILKLEEESKTKATETAVMLAAGDIWANVDEVKADASFEIFTPVAAAAITGTVLRMSASADSAMKADVLTCWVYQGHIAVTPLKADGRALEDTTFTVSAGQEFTILKEFEEYKLKEKKAFEEFQKQQIGGYEEFRKQQKEAFKRFRSFRYEVKELDLEKQLELGWVRWNLMRDERAK